MLLRNLPVLAGMVSTGIFVLSYLPMLVKAGRTRDLSSYSVGSLALANVGNAVHSVYVFSLPMGPIWALHSFYLGATALMFAWYLRYSGRRAPAASRGSAQPSVPGSVAVSVPAASSGRAASSLARAPWSQRSQMRASSSPRSHSASDSSSVVPPSSSRRTTSTSSSRACSYDSSGP